MSSNGRPRRAQCSRRIAMRFRTVSASPETLHIWPYCATRRSVTFSPLPPIMIGGSGEKVTLRLVAQYGQMCNVSGDAETVRNRMAILREHCARLGRPFEDITVTNHGWVIIGRDRAEVESKVERLKDLIPRGAGLAGTPDELIEHFRAYAAAGSRYCTIQMPDWIDVEPVRLFAETVIPALASI